MSLLNLRPIQVLTVARHYVEDLINPNFYRNISLDLPLALVAELVEVATFGTHPDVVDVGEGTFDVFFVEVAEYYDGVSVVGGYFIQ